VGHEINGPGWGHWRPDVGSNSVSGKLFSKKYLSRLKGRSRSRNRNARGRIGVNRESSRVGGSAAQIIPEMKADGHGDPTGRGLNRERNCQGGPGREDALKSANWVTKSSAQRSHEPTLEHPLGGGNCLFKTQLTHVGHAV